MEPGKDFAGPKKLDLVPKIKTGKVIINKYEPFLERHSYGIGELKRRSAVAPSPPFYCKKIGHNTGSGLGFPDGTNFNLIPTTKFKKTRFPNKPYPQDTLYLNKHKIKP